MASVMPMGERTALKTARPAMFRTPGAGLWVALDSIQRHGGCTHVIDVDHAAVKLD